MPETPTFSIGIEEEYQIIDPQTRELKSYITELLEAGKMTMREQVKAELHQSIVEVGTKVCHSAAEARDELVRLRRGVMELAGRNGLKIAAAGSHPISSWVDQEITPFERYAGVKEDMKILAQQLLIFGTHVHIGIEDPEFLIDAMNVVRYFMPHVLCLSTSSPFWIARDTGLKSYRSIIFRNFPRTGIPPYFESYTDFVRYRDTLVKTNSIPDGTKIWFDVRPNYNYPTLEFRICDVSTRVDEAVCVAAIFQALIFKLWKMRRDNITFRIYSPALIEDGKQTELPARELIREMIEWFIGDVMDELGSRKEIEYAYRIMDEGTSADRQLETFRRTNNLQTVVDQLIVETEEGVL
jgi:glutamate---cysteine ligase / carboxylate-amine ligase